MNQGPSDSPVIFASKSSLCAAHLPSSSAASPTVLETKLPVIVILTALSSSTVVLLLILFVIFLRRKRLRAPTPTFELANPVKLDLSDKAVSLRFYGEEVDENESFVSPPLTIMRLSGPPHGMQLGSILNLKSINGRQIAGHDHNGQSMPSDGHGYAV